MIKKKNPQTICTTIINKFENFPSVRLPFTVAYFIWRKPYMSVGRDTFIHDMLERIGLVNVFKGEFRYPQVDETLLKKSSPDFIFLSSEPYPFKQQHLEELQLKYPDSRIMLVDGEYFSWYGSRLLQSGDYFRQLIDKLNLVN